MVTVRDLIDKLEEQIKNEWIREDALLTTSNDYMTRDVADVRLVRTKDGRVRLLIK